MEAEKRVPRSRLVNGTISHMSNSTETFPASADDAHIPDSLRELVNAELNDGETIRWIEQPTPVFFSSDSGMPPIFGWIFIITFVITIFIALANGAVDLDKALLGFIGASLLAAVSATLSIWGVLHKQAKQVVYVITDHRAIIAYKTSLELNVTNYYLPELSYLSRKQRANGTGHLYFSAGHSKKNNNSVSDFFNIRNVQEVERLIQELKGTKE